MTANQIETKMANEVTVFRLVDVALHNKSKGEDKSIWTVIHDKVYDITKFLDEVVFLRETSFPFLSFDKFSILEEKRFS